MMSQRAIDDRPSPEVADAIMTAAGSRPERWWRVVGGGYTPAERWLVDLRDGSRAFAKVGINDLTGGWLRTERRAYADVGGAFMPRLRGWADNGIPVLLLEDLSGGHWPPPWDERLVARMLTSLGEVALSECPAWAPPVESRNDIFGGWSTVAADPEPFLALGFASASWLSRALPSLTAHEAPPDVAGDALLHFDVRSDNMCFTADRALLVDWNWIARGSPLFDIAAWLPSLAFEGGPAPENVSVEAGMFAPAIAGYFAAHAGRPPIADAPHVRAVQRQQLSTALPWAARVLGLPRPDGVHSG